MKQDSHVRAQPLSLQVLKPLVRFYQEKVEGYREVEIS